MTERFARKPDFRKKLLLCIVGLIAVAVPIVFGLATATQSGTGPLVQQAGAKLPEYEIASIKPDKSGDRSSNMLYTADGIAATNATLRFLIRQAYGIDDDQILGAPGWVRSETYDVEAKVDGSDLAELRQLNLDQRKLMLQPILTDRFKLKFHFKTKELPVYQLTIAKSGPKLKEATPGDTYPNGFKEPDGRTHAGTMRWERDRVTAQGISIVSLVKPLSRLLDRTVVDKTGLTGKYDFTLQWTPEEDRMLPEHGASQQSADSAPPPDSSGPSIFTALQEQLGLRLVPAKGSVEVLVIDHVEPPSAN